MNRPGLTLLELVVALVILAAILAAGYGALGGTLDAADRHALVAPRIQRAVALRHALTGIVSSVYSTPDDQDPGFTLVPNGMQDSRLSFPVTELPWIARARGIAELYIDGSASTPESGLVLLFRGADGSTIVRELSPWVERLAARVLVMEAGHQVWRDVWASSAQLPLAVEIRMIANDSIAAAGAVPLLIPLVTQ